MGNFTDLFIRRPVLSIVISLLIFVLGLRAVMSLPVLEYPYTHQCDDHDHHHLSGRRSELWSPAIITTPLENAVAQVNGIDYMTSTSQTSASTITINLQLNHDPDSALTEINAKINSVLNQLPIGTQQPVLVLQQNRDHRLRCIMAFSSTVLRPNQISDYLTRVVQPQIQAVAGVQTAEILGA